MKRLTVILMTLALVLAGAAVVQAQDLPQALQGVNLNRAQALTPAQAQQIRGSSPQGNAGILLAAARVSSVYQSVQSQGTYNVAGVLNQLYTSGAPPSGLPYFPSAPSPAPGPSPTPSPSPVPGPAPVKSLP